MKKLKGFMFSEEEVQMLEAARKKLGARSWTATIKQAIEKVVNE